MDTIAYVDGFNLYFGRLRGTSYKWLDVHTWITNVLHACQPQATLLETNYFTAPLHARFSRRGRLGVAAHAGYIRAIASHSAVVIHRGRFSVEAVNAIRYAEPPNKDHRVRIWRIEEKETDVAMAVAMYRDAVRHRARQIVLISNDSDLAPALRMMRADTQVQLGVIATLPEPTGASMARRPSADLLAASHWSRQCITDHELAAAQLPACIQTKRSPIHRPSFW
jgi:hypothetical protein